MELPRPDHTQRVRLSAESEVVESTSDSAGERFSNEISYLGHYVPELGRILGMREIRFGIVEDMADQIAFRFSEESGEIEGMVGGSIKEMGGIRSGIGWAAKREGDEE